MKEKQVTQFSCDFCKVKRYRRHAMERHERGCTMNPGRVCGICARLEWEQSPIEKLISMARIGREALATESGGCPACMLAAIRQLRAAEPARIEGEPFKEVFIPSGVAKDCDTFDYKAAVKSFWADYADDSE